MSESPQPYRVLARKYRPQTFSELIGQEAMVQTLANAIARGRLAHAFLLSGVRGIGKTSTARLIAKALNCVGPDGTGGPTIDPCGACEPCVAIAEGRHIDVIEMDAASNRGIDDIREVIDAVRYAPASARNKVYIVDEVHMLTKEAFNALLKTLEEPPPHVKFLFATTELAKVPVTILSRCQRFDLRRIPAPDLAAHFTAVAKTEGVEIEDAAALLIARAAEGSARDGLSMLDQAITYGDGPVTSDQVRAMLGLADRSVIRVLLGHILAGDAEAALEAARDQHDLGIEPSTLLRGLMENVHAATRAKLGGSDDPALSDEEKAASADWAGRLSHALLHRLWQMLLKGLAEVEAAPMPREAGEMAILRLIYAAELPDPGALAERLGGEALTAPAQPIHAPPPASTTMPRDFADLVERLFAGDPHLGHLLHDGCGLVRFAPGELAIVPKQAMPRDFAQRLGKALEKMSGTSWKVRIAQAEAEAAPSLRESADEVAGAERRAILDMPVVQAVIETFPGAELVGHDADERRSL